MSFSTKRAFRFLLPLLISLLVMSFTKQSLWAQVINTKLNPPLIGTGSITEYSLSPDGQRIIYQGAFEMPERQVTYFSLVTGGKSVNLAPSGSDGDFETCLDLKFSSDSHYIVYASCLSRKLWSIDLNQAYNSQSIPKTMGATFAGGLFDITPDSQNVVYYGLINPGAPKTGTQLYKIPVSGGTPISISNPISVSVANLSDRIRNSLHTFDSNHSLDEDVAPVCPPDYFDLKVTNDNQFVLENDYWLTKIPLNGSPVIRLDGNTNDLGNVHQFAESKDGKFVVFNKGCIGDSDLGLYRVPYNGGEPVKLDPTIPISATIGNFQLSRDSNYVVYKVDASENQAFNLYSVSITGGVPVMLNNPLVNGGTVLDFALTPDDKSVIYRAEQEASNVAELYQVPAGGGVPRKLNSSLVSGGNVKQFFVTGNQWVVYLADQEVDERFELYSASLADGKIVKLSGNLQSAGNIVDVAVSPDGTFAVYRADQEQDGVYEIYHVPSVGGTITKLNLPLVSGGDVREFTISADNTHIVYLADQEIDTVVELYSSVIATHRLFLPVVSR